MVDTPFFDNPPEIEALQADDIARAVMFAVSQPAHVDVNEILIRPTAQPTSRRRLLRGPRDVAERQRDEGASDVAGETEMTRPRRPSLR